MISDRFIVNSNAENFHFYQDGKEKHINPKFVRFETGADVACTGVHRLRQSNPQLNVFYFEVHLENRSAKRAKLH